MTVHNDTRLQGHNFSVKSGIRAKEAIALLRKFFAAENPRAPPDKRRNKTGRIAMPVSD